MATPTRFSHGVTNVSASDPLRQYGLPDPTQWHTYFNDFDTYAAGDWTITAIGTGTSALTDIDGGALLVTNSALDNDGRQHQKVGESFLLTAGKKTVFKSRFKLSDVVQSDLLIGLAVTDTTLLGATLGTGVTDGVFFTKDDGVATVNMYCQKDATTGQNGDLAITTLVNDTFVVMSWYYDGIDRIEYAVNDVVLGTVDASSTYLPDTELTVSFALLNGEAAAKTMTLDYILVAQER